MGSCTIVVSMSFPRVPVPTDVPAYGIAKGTVPDFSVAPRYRRRTNGHKLKHKKFHRSMSSYSLR